MYELVTKLKPGERLIVPPNKEYLIFQEIKEKKNNCCVIL
jgi:hypothetical protein